MLRHLRTINFVKSVFKSSGRVKKQRDATSSSESTVNLLHSVFV